MIVKLSTRMILGWLAVIAGGATLLQDIGPWFFFGGLFLSDVLRHRIEPSIPRTVERRRTWTLLPFAVVLLLAGFLFDIPESPTHPLNLVITFGLVVMVSWLIRDDIRIYRHLHEIRST